MSHSSLVDVERVALTLGELLDGFVFVGGCAAVLLAPPSIHPTLRPTEDVDCVVATTTYGAFRELEQELEKKGCQRCTDEGVICRWWINGVRVDLMPADESVLGLRSPWYAEVLRAPVSVALASGVSIQVVNLPVFLAMKFDAFSDRGEQAGPGLPGLRGLVAAARRRRC